MVPIIGRIRAHSIEEFGELISHRGEEFVYVLDGCIEVHTQFYTPLTPQLTSRRTARVRWCWPSARAKKRTSLKH